MFLGVFSPTLTADCQSGISDFSNRQPSMNYLSALAPDSSGVLMVIPQVRASVLPLRFSASPTGSRPSSWCTRLGASSSLELHAAAGMAITFSALSTGSVSALAIDSALMERRDPTALSSCFSARAAPTRRMIAARSGKIPITSVRRRISLLSRSSELLILRRPRFAGHSGGQRDHAAAAA